MSYIIGVDHITINVKDMNKTIVFYTEFLGLQLLNTVVQEEQEIIYIELPGGCRLELVKYNDQQSAIQVAQKNLGIIRHFALATDRLDAVWEKVNKDNIPVRMELTTMEDLGCRGILIEDPNGVEVELVERL